MLENIGMFILGLIIGLVIFCVKYYHILRKYTIIILNGLAETTYIVAYIGLFVIFMIGVVSMFSRIP